MRAFLVAAKVARLRSLGDGHRGGDRRGRRRGQNQGYPGVPRGHRGDLGPGTADHGAEEAFLPEPVARAQRPRVDEEAGAFGQGHAIQAGRDLPHGAFEEWHSIVPGLQHGRMPPGSVRKGALVRDAAADRQGMRRAPPGQRVPSKAADDRG